VTRAVTMRMHADRSRKWATSARPSYPRVRAAADVGYQQQVPALQKYVGCPRRRLMAFSLVCAFGLAEYVLFCRPTTLQTELYQTLLGSKFLRSFLTSSSDGLSGRQPAALFAILLLRQLSNAPAALVPTLQARAQMRFHHHAPHSACACLMTQRARAPAVFYRRCCG
jgi:hypothetical protein